MNEGKDKECFAEISKQLSQLSRNVVVVEGHESVEDRKVLEILASDTALPIFLRPDESFYENVYMVGKMVVRILWREHIIEVTKDYCEDGFEGVMKAIEQNITDYIDIDLHIDEREWILINGNGYF